MIERGPGLLVMRMASCIISAFPNGRATKVKRRALARHHPASIWRRSLSSASLAYRPLLQPILALLLSFPVALFTIALMTDIVYLQTAEVQWTNFSSWLIVGALVFGGIALAWSLILAIRARAARFYALLLALSWIAGLVNAFQHSRDAWSSVGTTGLILSILSAALAIAASWLAHGSAREMVR